MEPSKTEKKKSLFEEGGDDSSASSSSSHDSSSESSSSSSDDQLKVNKSYAREYQTRKQREELRQVRERDEQNTSDESSSEEEDEDGDLLTNSVNLQFLKTIKALRGKENSIYDPTKRFFDEPEDADEMTDGDEEEEERKKKRKPQRFKDVVREQILEQMDDEGDKDGKFENESSKPLNSKLAYDDQQQELRKAFLKESGVADQEDSDGEGDDWMVVKKKGVKLESDAVEGEFIEQFQEIEKLSSKQDMSFEDPRGEIEDGNKFLLDYIKNKKWIDKNLSDDDNEDRDDDSSLEDIERADDFEASYNFRFEQAEAEATSGAALSIQTYARGQTMNTVRRKDTTRVDKRQARKERKAAERKAKEEQLKRLKNAKRQEMDHKLSQVRSVLGSVNEEAVDEVTLMKMLEGDYDPEKFEKAMEQAYGDDFYEKEDAEWKTDLDVRQSLKEDEDGEAIVGQDDVNGGMYDTYDGQGDEGEEDYDDEEMEGEDVDGEWGDDDDAMFDERGASEETELEKKVKAKMQEELYKLDYEDIVAGMPTRFKYRQVEANSYGLTAQEILLARDTTLKQFVSLKKMAPYNEEGEYNAKSKKRRRFREMLKQDMEEQAAEEKAHNDENVVEPGDKIESDEPKKKKRRRLKKGKKKSKEGMLDGGVEEVEPTKEIIDGPNDSCTQPEDVDPKSKQRRKKKGKKSKHNESNATDETDFVSRSDKKKEEALEDSKKETIILESDKKRKKRKKKKSAIAGLSASRLSSYGL